MLFFTYAPPWIWRFFCDCQKLQGIKKAQDLYLPVPHSKALRLPITVKRATQTPHGYDIAQICPIFRHLIIGCQNKGVLNSIPMSIYCC